MFPCKSYNDEGFVAVAQMSVILDGTMFVFYQILGRVGSMYHINVTVPCVLIAVSSSLQQIKILCETVLKLMTLGNSVSSIDPYRYDVMGEGESKEKIHEDVHVFVLLCTF